MGARGWSVSDQPRPLCSKNPHFAPPARAQNITARRENRHARSPRHPRRGCATEWPLACCGRARGHGRDSRGGGVGGAPAGLLRASDARSTRLPSTIDTAAEREVRKEARRAAFYDGGNDVLGMRQFAQTEGFEYNPAQRVFVKVTQPAGFEYSSATRGFVKHDNATYGACFRPCPRAVPRLSVCGTPRRPPPPLRNSHALSSPLHACRHALQHSSSLPRCCPCGCTTPAAAGYPSKKF